MRAPAAVWREGLSSARQARSSIKVSIGWCRYGHWLKTPHGGQNQQEVEMYHVPRLLWCSDRMDMLEDLWRHEAAASRS